jgi:hypothetical protein
MNEKPLPSKPSDALERIADALERIADAFDNQCDGNIRDDIRDVADQLEKLTECVRRMP